ncbi:hypothetical protein BY996DRAFT_6413125 [Phakopsora pachyrhizi]|nr:hypothetical protein BY996DRAFT_6413125 [Phakopsora pachyrhizi]
MTQGESEKEANSLKKMITLEKDIPKDFLSLSSSSAKKRLRESSESYHSQLRDKEYSIHPEIFLSELDNQEQRKLRKIDPPDAENINSAVLFIPPAPVKYNVDKKPYENYFYKDGSNLPPQPLNPISFRNRGLRNSEYRLESLTSYSSPSTRASDKIPIYYSQKTNQRPNLPISSHNHNIFNMHSEISIEPKIKYVREFFLKNIQEIKSVKYQRSKNNQDFVESQAIITSQEDDFSHFENNEQRRRFSNSLELDKTPKISVHLRKLAEKLKNRGGATTSGVIGKADERLVEIKKGKRPVEIFNEDEKMKDKVIVLSDYQLEGPISKLITQENKLLWSTIFQDYKFVAEESPDYKKKLVLKVLDHISSKIKNSEDNSLIVTKKEIDKFLRCPRVISFKTAAEQIKFVSEIKISEDEFKPLHGSPISLSYIMEKASFKNIVSNYFTTDRSETAEWWEESKSKHDPLKKKKIIAKMFFVYTMIINKVFCEDPNQDLFMEHEKQAVEFLSIVFKDSNLGENGNFFLNYESMQHLPENTNPGTENLKKRTLINFNRTMENKILLVEIMQLQLTWRLIELWLAQCRSDLYAKLLIKAVMKISFLAFS